MTFALQNALLHPERAPGVESSLDFSQPLDLSFSPPCYDKFPCLRLAQNALAHGGTAPLVFNAANEIAVEAFLSNRLGFQQIPAIIEAVLSKTPCEPAASLDIIQGADSAARIAAKELI
jgi:1-deoxy-D-xylulose-5-phosphate reductoisomerase